MPQSREPACLVALSCIGLGFNSVYQLCKAASSHQPVLMLRTSTWQQAGGGIWRHRNWKIQVENEQLFVVDKAFPPGYASFAKRFFMPRIARYVQKFWRRRRVSDTYVMITYPQMLGVLENTPEGRRVYYCVDDYRYYWPERADEIQRLEDQVIDLSDYVLCVSQYLVDEFCKRRPECKGKTFHLPNGIERRLILKEPLRVPDPLHERISKHPRPVVGTYGKMNDHFGFDVLSKVAQLLPDMTFLILGRYVNEQASGLAECRRLGNIAFVGDCDDDQATELLRSMDALAILHPVSHPFVPAMCPNKLWTYFATSRPIVSTPIPEVLLHKDVVHVGDSPEELAERLRWLQSVGFDDGLAQKRLERAREHTWDKLAERMCNYLGRTAGSVGSAQA